MNVRIWYVRRAIEKSFGRSGGAYCPLLGIKQPKMFHLFSVFASRRRVTSPEDFKLQNLLPPSILILKSNSVWGREGFHVELLLYFYTQEFAQLDIVNAC